MVDPSARAPSLHARIARWGGLQGRIATALGAAFLLFVAAVVVLTLRHFEDLHEATVGRQQLLLATALADDIDARFRMAEDMLERTAAVVPPALFSDADAAQRFLDAQPALHELFDNALFLVGTDGRVVAESPHMPGGRGRVVSFTEPIEQVATSGGPIISRPYASRHADGRPAVVVGVPVRDASGSVVGQLHGGLELLGENFLARLARFRIGEGGYVFLVASDRTIILHPDTTRILSRQEGPFTNPGVERAMQGFEGWTRTRTRAGVDMIAGLKRLATTGWVLGANHRLDEARASLVAARGWYLLALAAGTAIVAAVAFLAVRRITRPLVSMTAQVEEQAAAGAELREIQVDAVDEVGTLAAAFNRLVKALEEREGAMRRAEAERLSLAAQVQQQQRLESLGVLAGGIAHDFNNLLTPIISCAGVVREELGPDHPARPDLDAVLDAARRGADLTRRILAFGRRQVLEVRPLDLAQEILALHRMLRPLIGARFRFDLALADGLAPVRADRTQLQQVVVNLVVNARDAMPDGGTIRIATSEVQVDDPVALGVESVTPGRYGVVEVSDTGTGIDPAARERIFEPFFTTKAPDKGTGLGLATVYGILRQHRGAITVDSAPGCGSTFRVYLPTVAGEAEQPLAEPSPRGIAASVGRVMVVEDEPTVRAIAVRILRSAGFEVEAMDGPGSALARFTGRADFDLVLTDVVMPEMSGPELVARLRTLRPGLRAVFMSGYPAGAGAAEQVLGASDALVAKPFDGDALIRTVRSALAA